ncbi:MAG TPA: sigma-70 family RNA polymerase sigma factor, partial [Tepidisphaeraceae bacterium]|nr:sigma-70 family RNA polymerase sigma factor [Tepidisphaeraceae bacterium]
MTAIATQIGLGQADADLVAASRQGNREAFGQIVRKYQGLISGLIYSACGDLNASEDIAQETFLSAWKSFSGLREPEKLPAWLCQIARHRLLDQHRENSRQNARLARAVTQYDRANAPPPDEEAMSAEEREVLWRSLSEIAEPYRETLVLYYRQNQNTTQVAAALEISEDTVRQRLARGRQMLREQVAALLERNLVRSAPSAAFTSAVVAALPALMAQGATAAATGGVAKATTAAKGVALLPLLAMWIGPIIGLMGGIFGTARSIRATQTPRERRFVIRLSIIIWIYVFSAMAVLFAIMRLTQRYHWSMKNSLIIQSAFWLIYCAALVAMILKWNRRHRQLRLEEGLSPVPAGVGTITPVGRFISLCGPTVGGVAWIFAMTLPARDTLGSAITAGFTILLLCWAWLGSHRMPATSMRRFYFQFVTVLCAFCLIMLNWRLHTWTAAMTHLSMERVRQNIPLWSANLLLVSICILINAIIWVTTRPKDPNLRRL